MNELFKVHKLNDVGMSKSNEIAIAFDSLMGDVCAILSGVTSENSREFNLVRTHLEQACFYAKKAMAKQAENQE